MIKFDFNMRGLLTAMNIHVSIAVVLLQQYLFRNWYMWFLCNCKSCCCVLKNSWLLVYPVLNQMNPVSHFVSLI